MKHNPHVWNSWKHWKRMYRWMKQYNGPYIYDSWYWADNPMYITMMEEINEYPTGAYCDLCKHYKGCHLCPITENKCPNYNSPWKKVVEAKTKKKCLAAAKKMLKILWEARYAE